MEVAERPFEFSSFPARWGPSIGAALFGAVALLSGHLATRHGSPGAALVLAVGGSVALRIVGRWLLREGTSKLAWARRSSSNLIATPRGSVQPPEIWLVAHMDSKSQTIPMLLRVAAVAVSALFFVVMTGTLLVAVIFGIPGQSALLRPETGGVLVVAGISAWISAAATIPLILCFVGNKSRGALDNASGFACVALAIGLIGDRENVGVIVTSGEELGLAGARAFVNAMPMKGVALNCDTIDDSGRFLAMMSGRRPQLLSEALDRAAQRVGVDVWQRGMLPGILADNVAFSDAGWDSFTLSRGNLGTLARVHTSRDRADRIEGAGIAMAAQLLAATAEELS